MEINFINEHPTVSFINDAFFQSKLCNVFTGEAFTKEVFLNVVFLSDNDVLEINKEYLNHDFYMDIITFPIEETEACLEADIYISLDRVLENSLSYGVAYEEELLRVVLHGGLHLCGYKDKTPKEEELMRSKENYYMSL